MRRKLSEIDLNVTDRCNLQCTYCSVPVTSVTDRSPELTLDQLSVLFDEFEELGVVLVRIAGGEPFVRRDIEEIFRLAGHRRFKTIVLTNGLPVQQRHVELALELPSIDSFAFSVDGVNASDHWSSRGCTANFDRVLRSIDMCTDVGMKHSMMTVVTTGVVGKLIDLLEFAASRKMHELRLILPAYTGAARNRLDAFPKWEDWEKAIVDLTRFLVSRNDLPKVHVLLPHEDALPMELFRPLSNAGLYDELRKVWNIPWELHTKAMRSGESQCRAGMSSLTILPNGDAYGCDLMRNLPEFKCGNVLKEGVRAVFEDSEVIKVLTSSTTVRGCASFDKDSQTFACGQCRAGSRELLGAGLGGGGRLRTICP